VCLKKVHELVLNKIDVSNISFYEKSELFSQFPQYHIKILLRDLSAMGEKIFSNKQLGMKVYMKVV